MNRVVHFEIHAENPERAAKFYRDLFGWKIEQWGQNPYWMIITGEESKDTPGKWPGINGGLVPRRGPAPTDGAAVNAYACTVEVVSVDAMIQQAVAAGGKIALPKMAVPGVGWLVYLKDTEGNIFGMIQDDKTAK